MKIDRILFATGTVGTMKEVGMILDARGMWKKMAVRSRKTQ